MIQKTTDSSFEKSGLHPRNKHRFHYNFEELIKSCNELSKYVSKNKFNIETIDFSNPTAVKILNKALLKHFYSIQDWDIPKGFLCPAIPGRADYIHHIADLLGSFDHHIIPIGKKIKVLDIGIGANCVYPIIGNNEYGWQFVGTDIDLVAINNAGKIILANNLTDVIECRLQKNAMSIFKQVINPNEKFDLTICNPPFHASLNEAKSGTLRKINNLKGRNHSNTILNFGGQNNELFYEGGEIAFVTKMIEQSAEIPESCFCFSTLISKKSNLTKVYHHLKLAKATFIKTIDMAQGQKISRIVAWSFLNKSQQKEWIQKRWKVDSINK